MKIKSPNEITLWGSLARNLGFSRISTNFLQENESKDKRLMNEKVNFDGFRRRCFCVGVPCVNRGLV